MTQAPPPPHEAVERLEERLFGLDLFAGTLSDPMAAVRIFDVTTRTRTVLSHLRQVEEREAVMREALEPFAKASDKIHSGYDDGIAAGDHPMWSVFVSDLRKAKAALTPGTENAGE